MFMNELLLPGDERSEYKSAGGTGCKPPEIMNLESWEWILIWQIIS